MKESETCQCGNLHVDFDAIRFGANTDDKSIEVYIIED
jgi:hypothetical protein